MSFVICCYPPEKDHALYLVDRKIQRRSFWSDCLDDVMTFRTKQLADARVASLKFNSPRVLTFDAAVRQWNEDERNREFDFSPHPFSEEAVQG